MIIENFTKKQKFIIYLMIIIAIILIIMFLLKKDSSTYEEYGSFENVSKEENILETKENKNCILVYITGEVEKPDVVELNDGARIKDAIEKAGGLTDSAETKNLNLAYKVHDGEKIYIPSLDDVIKSEEDGKEIIYVTNKIEEENNKNIEDEEENRLVNINKATQTELETLPGIGPSMAKKIIDYRKENGNFNSIEDIKNVSGIGEAKYDNIKELISTN